MADFPTSVNVNPAYGLPGDFASANPHHSVNAPPGGFSAGPGGLTIGLAAWADTATGTILSNSGTGLPTGILHRANQAVILSYLSTYGYTVPQGFNIGELMDSADLYVKNFGTSAVAYGMKAFANNTNGTFTFAAAGTTVTGSTETNWYAKLACLAGEITFINKIIPG